MKRTGRGFARWAPLGVVIAGLLVGGIVSPLPARIGLASAPAAAKPAPVAVGDPKAAPVAPAPDAKPVPPVGKPAAPIALPSAAGEVPADHAAKMAEGLALFRDTVRGVLKRRCLECHNPETHEAGLDMSDRAVLLKGGDSGPAAVPGRGRDSLMIKLVRHQREPHMPADRPRIPAAEIAALEKWIDCGAPYDTPLAGKPATADWTKRTIEPALRNHWSYRPLADAAPPELKSPALAARVRNPIDRFVFARQQSAGVVPAPRADRRTLVRRMHLTVTGLPPTVEELDAVLADPAPDAEVLARLADRLLADPAHGERWARHWLDAARFAESHGFEHDYDRPTAFHFRDFVIRAFNDDLPFDTFVKWQIAGDEIAPDNPQALAATGYLAAGVHSTQITKNEVEKHRYDELDDIVATVGTSVLGLTLGCARCHDHKYDALPQRDYYRMVAAFTKAVRSEKEVDLDPEGHRRRLAEHEVAAKPARDRLAAYDRDVLPRRLAGWEERRAADRLKQDNPARGPDWRVATLGTAKADKGAKLRPLPDGSLLAEGTNADSDTYRITLTTRGAVAAVRLDALAHASLPKGGPGRAGNGNFALSDVRVEVAAPQAGTKPAVAKLLDPRADFEQKGLPVAATVDADAKSAWAVDGGGIGKDHAAVWRLERPLPAVAKDAPPHTLTVVLKFNNNTGHNLGRLRLSVSERPDAGPAGEPMPEAAAAALAKPAPVRSAAEAKALLAWYATQDADRRPLQAEVDRHAAAAPKPSTVKMLITSEGVPAVRLHTQGEDFLPETHFLRRGDPAAKEAVATPGFLQVMTADPALESRWIKPPPAGSRTAGTRRALAEWLTDVEKGAGALTARVIVNRLWHKHFGRGIVATPGDFGVRGEPPTHPELLEWLAGELVRSGWRLRHVHRLILNSEAWQLAGRSALDSAADAAGAKADPDNRLFRHRTLRRLEAEVVRDSLLAAGGMLDRRMYGAGTLDPRQVRRSIYFTVKRSRLLPMMVVFDGPDALGGVSDRPTTTVAPQALMLLNNPLVRQAAEGLARRCSTPSPAPAAGSPAPETAPSAEAVIERIWKTALGRPPTKDEAAAAAEFLASQVAERKSAGTAEPAARAASLADLAQMVLCLNEFVYVE